MHKYICDYRYGNKFCHKLCLACKSYLTNHIKKPKIPKTSECCGDSCPNCVWTTYFTEIDNYDKKVENTLNNAFQKAKEKEDTMKNTWKPYNNERHQ